MPDSVEAREATLRGALGMGPGSTDEALDEAILNCMYRESPSVPTAPSTFALFGVFTKRWHSGELYDRVWRSATDETLVELATTLEKQAFDERETAPIGKALPLLQKLAEQIRGERGPVDLQGSDPASSAGA